MKRVREGSAVSSRNLEWRGEDRGTELNVFEGIDRYHKKCPSEINDRPHVNT